MELNFKNNYNFQNILKQKKEEILRRAASNIQDSPKFKQLHTSFVSYLKSNAFSDFKAVLISKEAIESLPESFYIQLESVLNSDDGVSCNYLVLNNQLSIIDKARDHKYNNDSNEVRKLYIELSKDYVVFLLQPDETVSFFIDGDDFIEGIFLSLKDMKSYTAKKDISKIEDLFNEYQAYITDRNVYSNFFISKSHLKSLKKDLKSMVGEERFIKDYCHLLNNRPEDRLRENLRHFLDARLKATLLTKEYILSNFNRLDIFILDESGTELYLIEVKWVGESISADGKNISTTSFDETDINPKAVIQSVKYLKQLHYQKQNIKLGFLVVFDARKNQELADTVESFDDQLLEEDLKAHYRKFRKIRDFKIKNMHPS